MQEYLTFDDVLIEPSESDVEPREVDLKTRLTQKLELRIPIISAVMDRVTGVEMAIALGERGGLGALHRNNNIKEQVAMVKAVKQAGYLVAAGCGPYDLERAIALDGAGCDVIVIDCAHGHNLKVIDGARRINDAIEAELIVGNIGTAKAAEQLVGFAKAIKVGVGPGSACTSRMVSGVGVPQFSAIIAVVSIAKEHGIPVIADGGIRTPGDIAKALAAGASCVMIGNMLAGTDEAPGELATHKGTKYKEYRGMGSEEVLRENQAADRYLQGKQKVPEGVSGYVPYKGSVRDHLEQILGGLRISFGYVGARTVTEFQQKARFIRVTPASVRESGYHDIIRLT